MKLQFDSSQEYQKHAVKAITDIFEGQPLNKGDYEISFAMQGASIAYTEKGIANNLLLSDEQILQNIQTIQERNSLEISTALEPCTYQTEESATQSPVVPDSKR